MATHIAVIDLGSNTARLAIYYFDGNGIMYEIENIKRVLRLSSHLQMDQMIDPAGIEGTLACIQQFKELCAAREVSEIIGVATAAVRQAVNGPALLDMIEEETGIAIRLLSGEEEAYYGYLAVVNSLPIENAISIDIGGGSTEITLIQNRNQISSISFPFGAVSLTKMFLQSDPPSLQMLGELKQMLRDQFSGQSWILNSSYPVIAIGGAARNIAKIHQRENVYPFPSLHNYVLNREDIEELYLKVGRMSIKQRKRIDGLSKDRADIIVAGLAVFNCLMESTRSQEMIISNKGLRDGILYEKMLSDKRTPIVEDLPAYSVHQFMHRYQVNKTHAQYVCKLAADVFDQMFHLHFHSYGSDQKRLLDTASKLHDIGRTINMHDSSQHTFYLLSNVLLFGYTHRERLLIAAIASYKNKKQYLKLVAPFRSILLPSDDQMVTQLGTILLLARTLDRSMTQQVLSAQILKDDNQIVVECRGSRSNLMEFAFLEEAVSLLSKAFGLRLTYRIVT